MSHVLELVASMPANPKGLGDMPVEQWKTSVELLDGEAEMWDQHLSALSCDEDLERQVSPGEKHVKFGSSIETVAYESVSTYVPEDEDDNDYSGYEQWQGCDEGSLEKFTDLSPNGVWDFEGEVILEDTEQARNRPHLPEELPVEFREFYDGKVAYKKPAPVPNPWADPGASFAAGVAAGAADEEEKKDSSAPRRFTHRRQRSCPWQE
eukprot:CAMPEP_0179083564 /NCGR_PEP_ID=MMETSP0796-20121207/37742_1 /TAXON_ID=73915 /ORGANISM="Pyrodinium bahamense, Strain pbaha01" /LENGTH=207 /DNA_ID=CAMNT_0020780973 /DNA_START=39 /DNA_END=662 /DNA_ORIENTATION=-